MLRIALAVFLCSTAVLAGPCPGTPTTISGSQSPQDWCSGDLIFEDNFDFLDFKKWGHENTLAGGGNWEFQWYTNNRSNSFTRDGLLHIQPTLTQEQLGDAIFWDRVDINGGAPADECTNPQWWGCERTGRDDSPVNPIKSARVRTVDTFSFKYGRVEIRAKMPTGDWLWPAIWLLPRYNAFGGWPASGEIDLVESRGNKGYICPDGEIGNTLAGSTMHWGTDWLNNGYMNTHYERLNGAGWDSDFHNYGMVWTQNEITFSIDGEVIGVAAPPGGGFWEWGNFGSTGYGNPWVGEDKMAPFNQEFYILMNVAAGGLNFFPDDCQNANGNKPYRNDSPQAAKDFLDGINQWWPTWQGNSAMQVDYVRVWAL